MGEVLISKKDILKQTGITYGQFYRWKRMGLIPESWFVRKSTFTGQEAFLPQDKVLERIARIQQLKEDHSLDEIVALLSPEVAQRGYAREQLLRLDWLSEELLNCYDELRGERGLYRFIELFYIAVLERLRRRALSLEEIKLALATLLRAEEDRVEGERVLIIARKSPHTFCLICSGGCVFDPQTEVVVRLELGQLLEEIKIKMRGGCYVR